MEKFRETLGQKDFVLTAELSLSPQVNRQSILESARAIAPYVDGIQVPDHTNARPHISNLTVASLLASEGIDPIVHMNSRDRNRISLQSDLLSIQTLGISSVLLMRGTDLPADHRPRATGVFDVGAIDFITTAAAIRDGEALINARDTDATPFQIGAIAQVFDPAPGWTPEKLKAKTDAGANFIQLPLCMNLELLKRYMAQLISAKLLWKVHVLVSLAAFTSREEAMMVKRSLPDSVIPGAYLESLDESEEAGIELCLQMLKGLQDVPGISGANLLIGEDPDVTVEVIRRFQST